ncbi:hypothetical protein XELAEV_18017690mg [Xenopus laevis]|uniref:Histone deacetylase domain-containing protein n=1 Tax=Xenopus laevis TaxID=8355 RepID=A0A974DBU7_XENLA|nr:hypothetical protein XELAEV_18017690mg [Xenopus laevis]
MACGTALVYDEEMMSYKLLWDDPECSIEVPERLSSSYKRLQDYDLVKRCIQLPVREATDEEITLVHSHDYLQVVKSTQTMNEKELKEISQKYTAVFYHQNSFRCAKLSLGGTLQLVDAILTREVQNGMAIVRPPGHHSQRNQGNGFCVFNNVAIAAEYAKKKYKLERILIVDWDVHHGQGIQYIFEEDPSVLYFSWHRYEHKTFWPYLRESDYDVIGRGKGTGFNINLPWNKVGMGNADYIAAFFHVLLPLAFEFNPELVLVSAGYDSAIGDPEGRMCATPECFSHLTNMLMNLAGGKLCAVLEGGYNLRSLAESVCMTVRTLLGDPLPRLTGEMTPCHSALESIQNVRAAHTPYWKCLLYNEIKSAHDPSSEGDSQHSSDQQQNFDTAMFDIFLDSHMKKIEFAVPPLRTCAVLPEGCCLALPDGVLVEEKTATREHIIACSSSLPNELLEKETMLATLGKMLVILNKLLEYQTMNSIVLSPDSSVCATFAIKHVLASPVKRLLCINIGDLGILHEFDNDGEYVCLNICGTYPTGMSNRQIYLKWTESPNEYSSFFYIIFCCILPLAYNYQPDFIIITTGSNRTIGDKDISLLISLLQGLANGRILTIIPETEPKLGQKLVKCLSDSPGEKHFGPHRAPSLENIQNLKEKLDIIEKEWKMLQCSGKTKCSVILQTSIFRVKLIESYRYPLDT